MERCERCDREECQREATQREWLRAMMPDTDPFARREVRRRQILALEDCDRHAVDWRARALAAESRPRLSPEERATVERLRVYVGTGSAGSNAMAVLAIIDRLAPMLTPAPARSCPNCGAAPDHHGRGDCHAAEDPCRGLVGEGDAAGCDHCGWRASESLAATSAVDYGEHAAKAAK